MKVKFMVAEIENSMPQHAKPGRNDVYGLRFAYMRGYGLQTVNGKNKVTV